MYSYREGDWMVTTPLYVGSDIEVFRMSLCPHEKFVVNPRRPETIFEEGFEVHSEVCKECGAYRVRYRPVPVESKGGGA